MLRTLRILALVFFVLLGLALLWRVFIYTPPRPTAVTEMAPPTAAELNQADLVLDLFSPSDAALSGQLSETARKRQIEEAMTIGFMLRRCDLLDEQEYRDTYRALLVYAGRLQPDATAEQIAREMQNAVESSRASYAMLYGRVSCDLPQLATAASQLKAWREGLLTPAPR